MPVSGAVIGHEALARFRSADGRNLPPDQVFCALHDSPLTFQLELKIKQLQIAMPRTSVCCSSTSRMPSRPSSTSRATRWWSYSPSIRAR